MQDLYSLLQTPTAENLHRHSIAFFDGVIEKYPNDYESIITYINECYNYQSPFLVDEKDWELFLMERFSYNEIPEAFRGSLMKYECPEITMAMAAFLAYQKQAVWTTYTAKQDLRISMFAVMKGTAGTGEKKNANEVVSSLDIEINDLLEKLKADQKRFGNHKGFGDVKAAKTRHVINVAYWIDEI